MDIVHQKAFINKTGREV